MKQYKGSFQIARETDHLDGIKNIIAINKSFLAQDDSNLRPINSKFNATQRAINKIKRAEKKGLVVEPGLAYCLLLDSTIATVVNEMKN